MFAFALMLAFASFIFEMLLASNIPAWRKNAKKYKTINLILSVLLSFVMGALFGAAGLIVMTAAILSTLMSIPGYIFLYWCLDSPQAQARGGNQYRYLKKNMFESFSKFKQVILDLYKMIYKTLRFITFPVWGTRLVMQKIRK